MEELLIHVVFGLMVGFCGGYAGIGGAPILIFLYVNLLGYSQHIAQGTVLAMMLGTISIPGIWFMRDRVRDRLKPIIAGTLSYAAISYVGGRADTLFSGVYVRDNIPGLIAIALMGGLEQ